jgi:hypothetical protein
MQIEFSVGQTSEKMEKKTTNWGRRLESQKPNERAVDNDEWMTKLISKKLMTNKKCIENWNWYQCTAIAFQSQASEMMVVFLFLQDAADWNRKQQRKMEMKTMTIIFRMYDQLHGHTFKVISRLRDYEE